MAAQGREEFGCKPEGSQPRVQRDRHSRKERPNLETAVDVNHESHGTPENKGPNRDSAGAQLPQLSDDNSRVRQTVSFREGMSLVVPPLFSAVNPAVGADLPAAEMRVR